MDMLRDIGRLDLTADQKAKLAELKQEYGPKLKEICQARQAVLTPEQKQARKDVLSAAKAARAAGQKPGNVRKAIAAAVNLSAEQKAKLAKLAKAAATLRAEVREKALSILTPEQVAELKQSKKPTARLTKPVAARRPPPKRPRPTRPRWAGASRTGASRAVKCRRGRPHGEPQREGSRIRPAS